MIIFFLNDQVHILSKVKIINLKTKKSFEYLLVSAEDADFQQGKISVTSPVGKGLMGKKPGDVVEINTPKGILKLKVLKFY